MITCPNCGAVDKSQAELYDVSLRKQNFGHTPIRPVRRKCHAPLQRCQTRTCHKSITPEYWIDYFYRLLEYEDGVIPVDSTDMTPQQTAEYILADFRGL